MGTALRRYAGGFKAGDPTQMFQGWNALVEVVESLQAQTGASDPAPASAPPTVPPPQPAQFDVVGIDGKFVVFVTNPQSVVPLSVAIRQAQLNAGSNSTNTPILHHLESATTLNFDQSSKLKDYGVSSQLVWTDQDPNITRFFRLQSSYDGESWNEWQFFSSAEQCGPVGVWSGLLRTAALTPVNASYTPTTQPLTASTGVAANDATIDVAAFQVQYPASVSPSTDGLVNYNSGAIAGLLDNTLYYVYCLDPTYAGGAQTYFATTDNPQVTGSDATVYLGTITTPAHGGGGTGGSGGGSGPCFTGNTRVVTRDGIKAMREIVGGQDEILTQRGWRRVRHLIEHAYDGPMLDMGADELVTPPHCFWWQRAWSAAVKIFPAILSRFTGKVFNLDIEGDGSDEEQCYLLANGWIAHNQRKAA